KLIRSVMFNELLYHFEGDREVQRRHMLNNVFFIIANVSNNYLMKHIGRETTNSYFDMQLYMFFEDFEISYHKMDIIGTHCINDGSMYDLRGNYGQVTNGIFIDYDKNAYRKAKEMLRV